MNICTFRQKKLFKTITTTAFYQIQNGCIVLFYYDQKTKVEYFYRISDLLQTQNGENIVLRDPHKAIELQIQGTLEHDSVEQQCNSESDIYLGFESNGHKVYSQDSGTLEHVSFSPGTQARSFFE
ncbi:Hypothetical_protein [Hexamita inflata]|uniref:Hypothetical_protein n=1 Tax=Hexamita inflata TaxID=28002 RepID=A0AA86UHT5_9EUKA|nr:Hypothetical protein HINF_LOCUS46380 [Hexamita inflata]